MEKTDPNLNKALERLEQAQERLESLEKSVKMKEFQEIAKGYAILGEDEEELAKNLYDMKMSNEDNYKAYVAILDKSVSLRKSSGLFDEIGKNATGSGGAEAKAEARARDIMKADPAMSYTSAIAKAWEDPELMAEYDAEYFA